MTWKRSRHLRGRALTDISFQVEGCLGWHVPSPCLGTPTAGQPRPPAAPVQAAGDLCQPPPSAGHGRSRNTRHVPGPRGGPQATASGVARPQQQRTVVPKRTERGRGSPGSKGEGGSRWAQGCPSLEAPCAVTDLCARGPRGLRARRRGSLPGEMRWKMRRRRWTSPDRPGRARAGRWDGSAAGWRRVARVAVKSPRLLRQTTCLWLK